MNPIYVACIGSRETPAPILEWMRSAGEQLVRAGYRIVSGNAPGADQAWAAGGNKADPSNVTLCLPWEPFEAHAVHSRNNVRVLARRQTPDEKRYYDIAAATHPHWLSLTMGAQRLHARNAIIVETARVVLGYMQPGSWGTASAFRIAKLLKVPTINVDKLSVRDDLASYVLSAVRG